MQYYRSYNMVEKPIKKEKKRNRKSQAAREGIGAASQRKRLNFELGSVSKPQNVMGPYVSDKASPPNQTRFCFSLWHVKQFQLDPTYVATPPLFITTNPLTLIIIFPSKLLLLINYF